MRERDQRAAALTALHPVEGRRDVGQGDPVGDAGSQVEGAVRHVRQQTGDVLASVGVAVDAADQGAREVEELQRVEGDLLVPRAYADDHAGASAAYGGP